MKSQKIFDAITNIKDEYITEANVEKLRKKKLSGWAKSGIAAAAAIAVFAGIGAIHIPLMGAGSGGGSNREPGTNYMSYAGPAFPLATLEELSTDVIFERETDFDFSPYYPHEESYESSKGETVTYTAWDNDAVITDTYKITNNGTEDITFTGVYPVAGSINMPKERLPKITVNGEKSEIELKIGPYSNKFIPVLGSNDTEGTANLFLNQSWEEYKILLEGSEYQEAAFDENPTLDIAVKVYTFTVEYLDDIAVIDALDNPDFSISYNYDFEKTNIFYMGFNGGRFSSKDGFGEVNTGVPKSFNPDYQRKTAHIIVLGDDLSNMEIKCYDYADGAKTPTSAYKINTQIREMTIGEILLEQIKWQNDRTEYWGEEEITLREMMTDEEYLGYVAEYMYANTMFAEDPKDRYSSNMLDDILNDVSIVSRVIYSTFEITVPAGETVTVEAKTLREASYDFYGKRNSEDLEGFDLVTKVGTNLLFTKQTASVSKTEYIEIIYNNFGFDLENGITKVTLGNEEHYYLEIKHKE